MPRFYAALLAALCTLYCITIPALADTIYKHVDEYGNVTYSDEPATHTTEALALKPLNTTPAITIQTAPTSATPPTAATQNPSTNNSTASAYNIRMVTPKNKTQFGPADKTLTAILLPSKKLADNHYFQLSVDGKPYGAATKSNSINVELTRSLQGRRTLSASIVDDKNVVLDKTETITVYVIRPPIRPKTAPH